MLCIMIFCNNIIMETFHLKWTPLHPLTFMYTNSHKKRRLGILTFILSNAVTVLYIILTELVPSIDKLKTHQTLWGQMCPHLGPLPSLPHILPHIWQIVRGSFPSPVERNQNFTVAHQLIQSLVNYCPANPKYQHCQHLHHIENWYNVNWHQTNEITQKIVSL